MIKNVFKLNFKKFSNINPYNINNLKNNKWHINNNDAKQSYMTHKSDAQVNINKIPIIKIEDDIARCSGGSEILGHPTVYIKLFEGKHSTCKYCGLRFTKEHHDH